eukprot:1253967-Rhodomonas_salina.5
MVSFTTAAQADAARPLLGGSICFTLSAPRGLGLRRQRARAAALCDRAKYIVGQQGSFCRSPSLPSFLCPSCLLYTSPSPRDRG